MAKLADLKKYLGYEFSSGAYTGEDYKSFQTKYISNACDIIFSNADSGSSAPSL